jgi:uncharacterized protein (TIGR02328 family)
MRLWHQKLIPYLPRQQLLGQHRECCALRGNGWGKKHAIVDYVFKHEPERLVAYHHLVMDEMKRRGYNPDPAWRNACWRGNILGEHLAWANFIKASDLAIAANDFGAMIYPEHDDAYLQECLDNLAAKGILIENFKKI